LQNKLNWSSSTTSQLQRSYQALAGHAAGHRSRQREAEAAAAAVGMMQQLARDADGRHRQAELACHDPSLRFSSPFSARSGCRARADGVKTMSSHRILGTRRRAQGLRSGRRDPGCCGTGVDKLVLVLPLAPSVHTTVLD
jgi:hypothetical protein